MLRNSLHTYLPTYLHPYIPTYLHTYISITLTVEEVPEGFRPGQSVLLEGPHGAIKLQPSAHPLPSPSAPLESKDASRGVY